MTARSFVIIIPVQNVEQGNTFLEDAGFGPDNISVPVRDPAATYATHVGCHWWPTEAEVDLIVAKLAEATGFTETQVRQFLQDHALGGVNGADNFTDKLADMGLEWPDRTTWFDPPVMAGDTVKVGGKTWRSDVDLNVYEPGVYKWTVV